MLKYSKSHPDNFYPFLYLAAAYGHLGRVRDAKSAFETYNKTRASLHLGPATNALEQVAIYFFKDGGVEEDRLHEGLRKAGFDAPPEVVEASSEGITLKKPADGTVVRVYETANEHCRQRGKKSILISVLFPTYAFSCR